LDEQLFHEYMLLQGYLKDLMDSVLKFRDPETKMFYQVTNELGREGNYLETSGTCAIAYALMKGARLGYLPQYYYDYGKEIFDSVVKHKLVIVGKEATVSLPEGSVAGVSPAERRGLGQSLILKDVCLVAGLGGMPWHGDYKLRDGTFEYYISEPRVNNDAKGLAPFLFAYSEVLINENRR